ncbi:MAG: hypothetical protein II311_00365, partial [Lachnospiraceae bacterium]|nr:hypothetical protein [Lachnospiraceae bacterium]
IGLSRLYIMFVYNTTDFSVLRTLEIRKPRLINRAFSLKNRFFIRLVFGSKVKALLMCKHQVRLLTFDP